MTLDVPIHLAEILARFKDVKESKDGWLAKCPCPGHSSGRGDIHPSLRIAIGEQGNILVLCRTGCSTDDVLAAAALSWKDLLPADGVLLPRSSASKRLDLEECNIRDRAYRKILDSLELEEEHQEHLRKRGFQAEWIRLLGYKSIRSHTFLEACRRIKPGFDPKEYKGPIPGLREAGRNTNYSGIAIPVRQGNLIVAIKIRRLSGDPKYIYLSDAEVPSGSHDHWPLSSIVDEHDMSEFLRITEGEIKADLATCLSKTYTISVPGITNWRSLVEGLRSNEGYRGIKTLVSFDCPDLKTKSGVREQVRLLLKECREIGTDPHLEIWDQDEFKGIDDLLAAGHETRILSYSEAQEYLDSLEGSAPGLAPVCVSVYESLPAAAEEKSTFSECEMLVSVADPCDFPLTVYPPLLREFCLNVTERTDAPLDFSGVASLVVTGSSIGAARRVRIVPGWLEAPCFYAAVVAPPGSGKAQPLDATVFTPDGPVPMGDVTVGREVCTPDGKKAKVVGVFPQGRKEVYRLTFTDGSSAEACLDHLWKVTERRGGRTAKVVDTRYLIENRLCGDGSNNIYVEVPEPVVFKEREHLIPAYTMGALIGDGGLTDSVEFTNPDREVLDRVEASLPDGHYLQAKTSNRFGYRVARRNSKKNRPSLYRGYLEHYGLFGKGSPEKFIPAEYLYASVDQRWELLRGLMDTDGTVAGSSGQAVFGTSSPKLAADVKLLVDSLGGMVTVSTKVPEYTHKGEKRVGRLHYTCHLNLPDCTKAFRLSRKRAAAWARSKYFPKRVLAAVERVGVKECQCIRLDSGDQLYLTDGFVVTHNSPAIGRVQRPVILRQEDAFRRYKREEEIAKGDKSKPKPTLTEYYSTDITIAGVTDRLSRNPKGLLLSPDEIMAWVRSFGQVGMGNDQDFYLSIWNGQPVKVDRKTGDCPVSWVSYPYVSVLGSVQPKRLPELSSGGRGDDGFLDRFLFTFPPIKPSKPWDPEDYHGSGKDDMLSLSWAGAVHRLYDLSAGDDGKPGILQLSESGWKYACSWFNSTIHKDLTDPNFPEYLRGFWLKLKAYYFRFALALELLWWAFSTASEPKEISQRSLSAAGMLCEYFKCHAMRVAGHSSPSEEVQQVSELVRWAWIGRKSGVVTARDVVRSNNPLLPRKMAEARNLLVTAQQHGAGQFYPEKDGSRDVFVCNPTVKL